MKKIVILMVLFSVSGFAQDYINYKALIKDGSGNVVANTAITVQFQILEDVTNVYQETHNPTTDANGLIILNIGEGTTGDVFADIDWGNDYHFLNVQIDTGSGLVDLGTTQFMAVPYALNAGNVSLEAIDQGNGIGWRLKGSDPNNHGLASNYTIDLSKSFFPSSTPNSLLGKYTFATGIGTVSRTHSSASFGRYNTGNKTESSSYYLWHEADPLFEVGNGISDANRTNALTILKNGTITAPTFDIAEITDAKALITKEYLEANGSSGLETLDEGNGFGWRLIGQDPANYGNIGFEATDLSYSNSASTTRGATGSYSTAMGFRTISSGTGSTAMGYVTEATGNYSTAMGSATEATGSYSTAMGFVSRATGYSSTAMGRNTDAIGESSTVMGFSTDADSYASLAMGRYNVGGGDATNWVETDPLLEVGNGADNSNKTNALTILKNGTITAPTFDLAEITDAKALITKEYADANLLSSGLETLDEGNGFGWRLIGQDPANYGNIGDKAVDLSYSNTASSIQGATGDGATAMGFKTISSGIGSAAMGWLTDATGNYSTALGYSTEATGDTSTAMGYSTEAAGGYSTAMGDKTFAFGYTSTAMGNQTVALGNYSTAMGFFTDSASFGSVAMGRYNVGGGDATTWVATDPLFEIGNGTNSTSGTSNALTVLKNGDIGIGTATPDEKLSVAGILNLKEDDASVGTALKVNGDQALWYDGTRFSWGYGGTSNTFANNVGFGMTSVPSFRIDVRDSQDTDYIAQVYNTSTNTAADGLKIRLNASSPGSANFFVGFFDGSNSARGKITGDGAGILYQTVSDRRLKTNIKDVIYALDLIEKIQPRKYEYKSKLGKEEYGFIAQELQPLYPQAVTGNPTSDVKTTPMMVDYSRLTPLLTAGIKELNNKVENLEEKNKAQQKIIENLEAALLNKKEAYSNLNNRLVKIEALLINKSEDSEVASNNK